MQTNAKVTGNIKLEKAADVLFFLSALTSSFDIFLALNFGGFNIRITQVFQALLICIAIYKLLVDKIICTPKSFVFLLFFTLCNILCTFHTILPVWNIAYNMWLILFVLMIWAIFTLYRDRTTRLLELYVASFYLMAIWGCLQFFLGLTGISNWMIMQWWVAGFPRVNGFTYEPSYFATYMIMGYLFSQCCCFFGIYKIGKIALRSLCYISTIAIVLCSSRMVYIPIACMLAFVLVVTIKRLVKKQEKAKDAWVEFLKQYAIIFVFVFYFFLMQTYLNMQAAATLPPNQTPINPPNPIENIQEPDIQEPNIQEPKKAEILFVRNVGAGGDYANINLRLKTWKASWNLFLMSPIYGYGLGGISAEAMRIDGRSIEEMKQIGRGCSTGNVFLEILAATGIIGTICFLIYGWGLVSSIFNFPGAINSENIIRFSLIIALVGECIMLAMNQNILRNYAWLHVAVLSCYVSQQTRKNEP